MLCSKKMILPSKFNVKLQKKKLGSPRFAQPFQKFRVGGGDFFSGGPGGGGSNTL
jgi:hypothetical protein